MLSKELLFPLQRAFLILLHINVLLLLFKHRYIYTYTHTYIHTYIHTTRWLSASIKFLRPVRLHLHQSLSLYSSYACCYCRCIISISAFVSVSVSVSVSVPVPVFPLQMMEFWISLFVSVYWKIVLTTFSCSPVIVVPVVDK